MTKAGFFLLWAIGAVPLGAQWVNFPTPGLPRLPDGKPNLSAPAPRTTDGKPDLSGLWEPTGQTSSAYLGNTVRDPKFGDVSTGMKGGHGARAAPKKNNIATRDFVIKVAHRPSWSRPAPDLPVTSCAWQGPSPEGGTDL
jgi:hypothetical protein